MKKLLSIFGMIGMVATTGAVVVACQQKPSKEEQENMSKQEVVVKKLQDAIKKANDDFAKKCDEIFNVVALSTSKPKDIDEITNNVNSIIEDLLSKNEENINESELWEKVILERFNIGVESDEAQFDKIEGSSTINLDFNKEWMNQKIEVEIDQIINKQDLTNAVEKSIQENIRIINDALEAKAEEEAEELVNDTLAGNLIHWLRSDEDVFGRYQQAKKEYKEKVEKTLAEYNEEITKIKDLK
ncbi:lipoprotein [Mycoplasma cottewii]|uniref:Lipoprotein n=1 Tax=Mycoplasma cottewii TaxID=51364 RepID=A0ABY5TZZ9_9MOLU|nr:lipoprotein [Mycoplasma cottewii]UWD35186.1 lipoprotein [Mycoplasma cottewii]